MPARTLPLESLDRLPIAIFRLDLDLRLGYVSSALATDIGFPPEAVSGKTLSEIGLSPENAAFLIERYQTAIRTGEGVNFEWAIDFPTGPRWFQNYVVPEFDTAGAVSGVIGYTTEITALKQAQIEEQNREARMFEFLTQSPFGAWLKDADGRYVFVNRALAESHQITSEAWLGKTDSDIFPLLTASTVRANDQEVLTSGRFRQFTEHAPGPDGDERVWMTMKFPFRDHAGRPHVAGIGIDLTEVERERAERSKLSAFADLQRERSEMEAQLLKSQKLESLGVLAGGIAHDFNNLLTSVLGYASLLRMQLPPNTGAR